MEEEDRDSGWRGKEESAEVQTVVMILMGERYLVVRKAVDEGFDLAPGLSSDSAISTSQLCSPVKLQTLILGFRQPLGSYVILAVFLVAIGPTRDAWIAFLRSSG